ncbi:hypothetical protein SAMN04487959_103183 [Modicisalibacter xianhensis]|uniref:Uncharacterized protein n=1 Tax=Modicisalibacter xianhensis TaxID=442341 RepID=A0A1I2ZK89_9GAMM|nr:hypothetical protein SAMN04487959_103183 [Halomonas xianhensis]
MTACLWRLCSIVFSQFHRADQGVLVAVPASFTQIKLTITDVAAGHAGLVASSPALLVEKWKTASDSGAIAGWSSEPLLGWGG